MMSPQEWKSYPYLHRQLLSYLGNKRRLLPFLQTAILKTGINPHQTTFVDPFAGSGAVSRLAKAMGFHSVISNDWEPYSYTTQALYLKENPRSIRELFSDKGGLESVLRKLNGLENLKQDSDAYISRYYAPRNLEHFDTKKERLFYTPQNAIKLDAMRTQIEEWYPAHNSLNPQEQQEKNILVALLLYEASVHTNTGGVFKAYYKEFGGYGHHALKRILSPICLSYPILEDGDTQIFLYQEDALKLSKKLEYSTPYSLVYLDPPYNIHQYGSNYHMLNTLTLWDRYPLEDSYTKDGYLRQKSGIRQDWQNTRSSFCSKLSARESFESLVNHISADILMVSYSTDGLIEFQDMLEILEHRGEVQILFNPYVKYRGGKKSLTRVNHNMEFVLWVDTRKPTTAKKTAKIFAALEETQLTMQMWGIYKQNEAFFENFVRTPNNTGNFFWKKHPDFSFRLNEWGEFLEFQGFASLGPKEQKELSLLLAQNRAHDKKEELEIFLTQVKETPRDDGQLLPLWEKIRSSLQFLAHPKNREDFLSLFGRAELLLQAAAFPDTHPFLKKWRGLMELFQKRNGAAYGTY